MTDDKRYDAAEVSLGLLNLADMADQMQEVVVARRRSLEADGFSPTMAEHMAAAMWMSAFLPGTTGGKS